MCCCCPCPIATSPSTRPPLSTSRPVLHCPEEPSHIQLPANIPRDISLQQTQPETLCSPAGKAGPLALLLTLKSLPHHPAPLCESVPALRMMKTILHLSGDCLCTPETAGCMLSPCKYVFLTLLAAESTHSQQVPALLRAQAADARRGARLHPRLVLAGMRLSGLPKSCF